MRALTQAAQALTAAIQAISGAAGSAASGVAVPGNLGNQIGVGFRGFHQPDPVSVVEGINEFLRAKARAGRSDRYLRQLRVSLVSFQRGRARVPLAEVTISDLEQWMGASNWAPRTQRGYLSDVRVLFNFCIRRGLCAENPAAAVELPEDDCLAPPGIHSPEQVAEVLECARGFDLDVCRALAVRYFAGLRASEAMRLRESEIHPATFGPAAPGLVLRPGLLEVTASNAKTRRRRLVTIQPALEAWLRVGGSLPLTCVNNRMRYFTAHLRRRTGIECPQNVARHSFVSYHLAHLQSASVTALEAGHSEEMIFSNYRELKTLSGELITPEVAARFWEIRPKWPL